MARKLEMTLVRAFPRIHIGLVDLGNATRRRYGGAGFMLDCMPVEVSIEKGPQRIVGLNLVDQMARKNIIAAIERLGKALPLKLGRISIRRVTPQHIGLGSKTALILALLKACTLFNRHSTTATDLQRLSGRGGASGVGVHGFFKGGFVVDAGHKADQGVPFVPSSAGVPSEVPPLITRIRIPIGWRFALFLGPGRMYSGAQEKKFFLENTPISKSEVLKTIAILHYGIIPAVLQSDIDELRHSLRDFHRFGFKHRELHGQTEAVRTLFSELSRVSECATGLSSMGPLIYTVLNNPSDDLLGHLVKIAEKKGARLLGVFKGRNGAHEVC